MKKVAITFDVEPDLHTGKFLSIKEGLPKIKAILDKHGVKGTFFTTCDCIEEYPELFRRLIKEGHEIALHGYRHVRFDDLTNKEKDEAIKKSIEVFKRYLKYKPKGFRAVQHSIDLETFQILKKYGIKYDSSETPLNALQLIFFPTRIKSNFINFFAHPRKHMINGVYEIPVTALGMPFVSLVPRLLRSPLQRIYLLAMGVFFSEVVFYAHSWDFIEMPQSRIDNHYSHKRFMRNFDRMLYLLGKKYKFVRMEDMI